MDKRVEKNKNSNENHINGLLLAVLMLLFCFTLYISLQFIIRYYVIQSIQENNEIIEITNDKINATITNSGKIQKKVNEQTFEDEEEIIIEKINTVEVIANTDEESTFNIDVKYNITKNNFNSNTNASNKSEVLVRFSYSYDNKEWIYINNVISTNTSNISPLIGNNYDIAGLTTALNVATNFEITANNKEYTKVYWRSETILKNLDNNDIEKELEADFLIQYSENK